MHNGAVLLQAQIQSKRSRAILTAILAAAVLAATTLAAPAIAQGYSEPQAALPKTQLSAGIHIIQAEVANSDETRQRGLMFRKQLDVNNGMLFVFERPDKQCFWMHNTPLPLSIAFIADDGTIVNTEDMAPETDEAHCSRKPVRYALEMAQGWFADHGMSAGKKIDGLP